MDEWRWTNASHPQPLQSAVMLLYIGAAVDLLFGGLGGIGLLLAGARVAAGGAIASEKRWGYQLGLGVAFTPIVLTALFLGIDDMFQIGVLLALAFDIILAVLLLNPQSREYQRVWFR